MIRTRQPFFLPLQLMSKSVAFYTLGCKLNFSETSSIQQKMEDSGFIKSDFSQGADIVVINTCSVTDHADKKCKKVVKEALSLNASSYIVVIGCYAQLKPVEIASIPGVDLVLGAAEKFNLAEHLGNLEKKGKASVYNCDIHDVNDFIPSFSSGDRTRTFLKIQDGCDYSCTYCTIPMARGKSRSPRVSEIINQVKDIAAMGAKEVVLTGVNAGDFGHPHGEDFFTLVKALDKVKGIERFRISSIEPNLLNDQIIEFVSQSERFVPHFHIPLQSGNNKILGLMKRRYRRELYQARVEKIKSVMPDACIGVDVIVGFPGETEEDFMDSYRFISALDISYLHVFTYSERPGTPAAFMPGRVLDRTRFERNTMLRILGDKKKREFYNSQLGTEHTVLWEADFDHGVMHGFTQNYIKVKKEYDGHDTNTLQKIKITGLLDDLTCTAQVIENFELV
jgi:threonylcarbamoyladenosine tRNA methylthiotransferase MtaB